MQEAVHLQLTLFWTRDYRIAIPLFVLVDLHRFGLRIPDPG